ncbi:PREDICTED: transmembrane protease serine 3-like [Ceratosolen solmsi marchali]|uniref:Transmembrane protease serine 3-like n=1 Tax=Ceratosolen solmsi marchali TaxID=326594 RepID=A0AAJ6YQK5_9HYME|nr:PREDICTED: transmembrane protease serine 3-like [Ceratosolen solmsi marchali]
MKIIFKTLIALLLVQVSYVNSWDHLRHASPGQFPHQAVLVWIGALPFPPFHLCGGAILNEFWILSSAYCVVDILHLNNVRIKVGSHNISLDDEHVRNVEVAKIIVHEKYTR